jgi:hypothetical protein
MNSLMLSDQERLPYRQVCPVAKARELLDERWTLLVIRELIMGSEHFNGKYSVLAWSRWGWARLARDAGVAVVSGPDVFGSSGGARAAGC